VYAHFAPMLDNQRREFPDAYRLVTLGVGLDGILVPEPEAFVRRRAQLIDLTALDDARVPVPVPVPVP
jgi:hypothetical protein